MALESRIRGSISLLLAAQNDDGSWSWTGTPGAAADRYASCRIVWAMTLARKAGYIVPDDAYQKALGYLRNQVAATDNADYESKAILLHALAVAGQGDFALANRLYRDRNALPPRHWPICPWDSPPWTARRRPRSPRPAGKTGPRRSARAATRPWGSCPGAVRLPNCGPCTPWQSKGRAQVAEGQGAGRLASGPSHRQPLEPGQGDGPRRAGLVPLVRR